jgi:glycine oxidase
MTQPSITIVGAGIVGLWQAYELARRGHRVVLREALPESASGAASRYAGAMLAPYCENEAAPPLVQQLGLRGLARWRELMPDLESSGTLVVAAARDQGELRRFARLTGGHRAIDAADLAALEPELAGRFASALYYAGESHVAPRPAMASLIAAVRRHGGDVRFADAVGGPMHLAGAPGELVIDCRGMAAREDIAGLRGVRGEMIVVRAGGLRLSRPVRLLHPRFPIYVVPWGEDLYMIGATMIEREDFGAVTVRSALELLGTACVVHPGFAEATIVELGAGVRPAHPDNMPRLRLRGRCIQANGVFRHGYLLSPVLAEVVADFVETGRRDHPLWAPDQPS